MGDKQFASVNNVPPEPWTGQDTRDRGMRCLIAPHFLALPKKVRRHLMRARKRKGFGWKRWSRRWLYDTLGLFGHYRVHRPKQLRLKALPA